VPVRLHAEINGRLSDPVETGAYYIAGEALADAVKHANATVVGISIKHRGQFLALAVREDGVEGAVPNGSGLAGLADASTPSPEPCSCSARQAAEPASSLAS
jgi:signal transduction histidine kinase